jgi:Mn2+/Fe2+ NRAMP family transporter
MNYWFEVAVITTLTTVGNIVMGHFEEGTPKWRRILKTFIFIGLSILISATAGRVWFFVFLALMLSIVLVIHIWWLPKHGIHGWTGEPKEKYYALRGWKRS